MVSTVIATLFLRTTLHTSSTQDGQTYLGLLFFAIIHMVRAHLKYRPSCACSALAAQSFQVSLPGMCQY